MGVKFKQQDFEPLLHYLFMNCTLNPPRATEKKARPTASLHVLSGSVCLQMFDVRVFFFYAFETEPHNCITRKPIQKLGRGLLLQNFHGECNRDFI